MGWDMTEPDAALSAFLASLPARPQLLGLGEPTHGVEAFPVWRNRVFESLVKTQGFCSIAIESDVFAGMRASAYVTSGQGTLDQVMEGGFSHGFGQIKANRDLLAWMRGINAERPEARGVRFYGFDPPIENLWAASPRHALLGLHAFLARHFAHLPVDRGTLEQRCGDDARWTNPAAAMNPSQSVGATQDARQLRVLTDDLLAFLDTQLPGLAAQDGICPDQVWQAQLSARTALGLLRYHAVLASSSPQRISQLLGLRDAMMAENLTAIAEQERPRGPTLVFAHSSHLQRGASQIRMDSMNADWWPAGAHLAAHWGQQYAFIGMASGTNLGLPAPYPEPVTPHLYAAPALTPLLSAGQQRKAEKNAASSPLSLERLPQSDGVLFLPVPAQE
ncbi:erythromycin esterase family protein [Deinococcus detaillensis]|uniref:Erythromycin esterase family protein n=1 Tax=Deinococcus detaillensis TaxID=2592048 RepID=A0A553V6T2_9DEIO|nr:erythromycin esterase family protein [Deinococcus detaillensis]